MLLEAVDKTIICDSQLNMHKWTSRNEWNGFCVGDIGGDIQQQSGRNV